ncbi:MAG: 2-C-methyl-D-erythritol 2,4-cyclodiphosphate synthase [bacterium]
MRTGIGFDAHRFAESRKLMLGGVHIEYPLGLEGHSDADVLIHAVMDAVLGAMGKGDIGAIFPDSSDEYRDISSMELLRRVGDMTKNRIINIDSVVICQEPKIAPYRNSMEINIADALSMDPDNVSVKASTTEYMGFTGRKEGIACIATVLLGE